MKIVLKFIALVLIISILIISFYKEIFTSYANFFTINNPTKSADGILILAGHSSTRTLKAIELYDNNFSKTILVTSPKIEAITQKYKELYGLSDGEITIEILKQNGINPKIIKSSKDGATSTFDEAYDLVNFLKKHHLKHIILVTDAFHSRRALYAFNKIFDLNNIKIKLEVASANNKAFNESNWYKSEKGLSAYVSEGFKFIIYLLRSRNLQGIKES